MFSLATAREKGQVDEEEEEGVTIAARVVKVAATEIRWKNRFLNSLSSHLIRSSKLQCSGKWSLLNNANKLPRLLLLPPLLKKAWRTCLLMMPPLPRPTVHRVC